jgi:hypothetical protein
VLLSILIGLEANSLKRWTYARRGRPAVDLLRASGRDEAEAKAFARWLAGSPQARQPVSRGPGVSPAGAPWASRPEAVIGLFPEPERPR